MTGTQSHPIGVYVSYCTCPDAEVAAELARALVDERLAACVNIIAGVQSVYRWGDQLETDAEVLLVIKTSAHRLDALIKRIEALHPYEVPEVIACPVAAGNKNYLEWVRQCTANIS
jgi:periplasmic divalent cation tolerance protein